VLDEFTSQWGAGITTALSVRVGGQLEQRENSERRGYSIRIEVPLRRYPSPLHPIPPPLHPLPPPLHLQTQKNREALAAACFQQVYFHILSYFLETRFCSRIFCPCLLAGQSNGNVIHTVQAASEFFCYRFVLLFTDSFSSFFFVLYYHQQGVWGYRSG
jgi:hypothetical protein